MIQRLKMFFAMWLTAAVLLVMAAGIVFVIARFHSPEAVGGHRGLDLLEYVLNGKAHFHVIGGFFVYVAAICMLFGIGSILYSFAILFMGEAPTEFHYCPHCQAMLSGAMPSPPASFSCPSCGKMIRRDNW